MGLEPLGGPDVEPPEEEDGRRFDLLRRREFWYLGIPFFVCGITTTGMIDTHLIPFAHDHGNGDASTSAAVGVLAVFNIIGTAGAGLLVDRYDPRRMLGWLYALRAVSLVMVIGLNQGFWLIQFGVLFGLVDFATVAPTQTLVSHAAESRPSERSGGRTRRRVSAAERNLDDDWTIRSPRPCVLQWPILPGIWQPSIHRLGG